MKKYFNIIQCTVFITFLLFIFFTFYLGFYKYLLTDDSSSLTLENTIHVAKSHPEANIIVLGDSTAAVEFRTNLFNSKIINSKAINLGMPGSWFYSHNLMQSLIKKNNKKVDTVILILGPDEFLNEGNMRVNSDLQYHKTSISIFDAYPLFFYSDSYDFLKDNLISLIFKPILFKKDLGDAIKNPVKRLSVVKRDIIWLNRKIKTNDPLWEDDRAFNVCNLGPLNRIEKNLEIVKKENDSTASAMYSMNLAAYSGRKGTKTINKYINKNLSYLITNLSKNFKSVYVLNSPIYKGFQEVYPYSYLNNIGKLTKQIANQFSNVKYITIGQAVKNDCSNFMDVVHLNSSGGAVFTEFIADYLNKSSK
jgi:hypothetical protein